MLTEPADIAAWSSRTTYPKPSDPDQIAAAHECDFWKYRGRGLIQVTWRTNYQAIVDPLLTANGHDACDDLSEEDLALIIKTDAKIFIPMVHDFLKRIPSSVAPVNNSPPDWDTIGEAISGNSEYGALLQWRCETLHAALAARGDTAT